MAFLSVTTVILGSTPVVTTQLYLLRSGEGTQLASHFGGSFTYDYTARCKVVPSVKELQLLNWLEEEVLCEGKKTPVQPCQRVRAADPVPYYTVTLIRPQSKLVSLQQLYTTMERKRKACVVRPSNWLPSPCKTRKLL